MKVKKTDTPAPAYGAAAQGTGTCSSSNDDKVIIVH
jgi:hypothetical protein